MNTQQIKELLLEAYPECQFDVSGEGCKLTVSAVGDIFAGKLPVKRQQLIYEILNPYITSGEIHAVTINASTPEEQQ